MGWLVERVPAIVLSHTIDVRIRVSRYEAVTDANRWIEAKGMLDRRLVLVTGAGASVALGKDRELPLMTGWADAISTALDEVEPTLASALNLNPGMSSEDFERTLGELLSAFRAVSLIKRYIYIGRVGPQGVQSGIQEWIRYAENREPRVIEAINRSLWNEFGLERIDVPSAVTTYRNLCNGLKAGSRNPATQLFSVTTNYDRSGQEAWSGVGFEVDDGGRQRLQGGSRYLDLRTVKPWKAERTVAHLHLHGAVGWYRTSHGIRIDPADRDFDDRLVPAVLYPDPHKDPYSESEPGVLALWETFAQGLEGATHLLVIGHSLHDRPLVNAIRERLGKGELRLAVTFLEKKPSSADDLAEQLRQAGIDLDGDVSLIPIFFGPDARFELLTRWIEGATVRADGTITTAQT